MLLVTVSVSAGHSPTDAADRSVRGNQRTICLDESWFSGLSHTAELDGGVSLQPKYFGNLGGGKGLFGPDGKQVLEMPPYKVFPLRSQWVLK